MRKWKIEDSNGNSISVTARNKTGARKQYKNMIRGAVIRSITDEGEAHVPNIQKIALPGAPDTRKFRPVDTIRNKKAVPGPNEPCSCGSNKKYKKCCMRRNGKEANNKRTP